MHIDGILPVFRLLSRKRPPILRMIVFSVSFLLAALGPNFIRAHPLNRVLELMGTVGQADRWHPISVY